MGRSKEKQAREEAEARARKESKHDSSSAAPETADAAPVPAEDKKRAKRSKEDKKKEQHSVEDHGDITIAAPAPEADLEGIERRHAREEAKREKEEKKGGCKRCLPPCTPVVIVMASCLAMQVVCYAVNHLFLPILTRPLPPTAARKQHRLDRNKVPPLPHQTVTIYQRLSTPSPCTCQNITRSSLQVKTKPSTAAAAAPSKRDARADDVLSKLKKRARLEERLLAEPVKRKDTEAQGMVGGVEEGEKEGFGEADVVLSSTLQAAKVRSHVRAMACIAAAAAPSAA
jgi:hypothetical protein